MEKAPIFRIGALRRSVGSNRLCSHAAAESLLSPELTTRDAGNSQDASAEHDNRARFRNGASGLRHSDVVQEPIGRVIAEGERQWSLAAVRNCSQGELLPSEGHSEVAEAEARTAEGDVEVIWSSADRICQVKRQRIRIARGGSDILRNGRGVAYGAKICGEVAILGREPARTCRDIADAGEGAVAGHRPASEISRLKASVVDLRESRGTRGEDCKSERTANQLIHQKAPSLEVATESSYMCARFWPSREGGNPSICNRVRKK